jgi:hypothetical protein
MGLNKLETTVYAMISNTFCSAETTRHVQKKRHQLINMATYENEPGELI